MLPNKIYHLKRTIHILFFDLALILPQAIGALCLISEDLSDSCQTAQSVWQELIYCWFGVRVTFSLHLFWHIIGILDWPVSFFLYPLPFLGGGLLDFSQLCRDVLWNLMSSWNKLDVSQHVWNTNTKYVDFYQHSWRQQWMSVPCVGCLSDLSICWYYSKQAQSLWFLVWH